MSHNEDPSPQPSLRLRLLGGFALERGGRPIPDSAWERPTPKRLLKVLAVASEHRMHREQVQELLWPELSPDAGYGSLRKALHLARRALEPESAGSRDSGLLRFSGGIITLDTDRVGIDADCFDQAMQRALAGSAPADIEAALALYTGPLLPEDIYEDWTASRRDDLAMLFRRGLRGLASLREAESDLGAATSLLQRLVREDPTDEEAHGRLMRLHAASGSRHLALRQYEACVSALRRELDTDPSPDTTAIYTEILETGSPGVVRRSSTSLPFSAPQLPEGPFIARERPKAILLQRLGIESEGLPQPRTGPALHAEPGTWSLEGGEQRLILVGGEAGVGKTRLLLEVAKDATEHGALVLWGSSYESEGKMAYGPIVEALRAHLLGRPEAERAAIRARFPEVCSLLPILSEAVADRSPSASPDQECRRLYSGVVRLLGELATSGSDHRPLLFVLDDIHEADQATLHLVHYLSREAANQSWLLVGTHREEAVDRNGGFAQWMAGAARTGLHQRVDLLRLARTDCDHLVRAMLGREPDPALLDQVYALSRGNALFASELVALQRENQDPLTSGQTALPLDDGPLRTGDLTVPRRVREFVVGRVHALGDGAWDVLTVAAVAGMEWPFAVVNTAIEELLPELSPGTLMDVVDRALETRIVEVRPSPEGDVVYGFRHPLFREALYQRISPTRRRHLHLTLARTIERSHPDDVEALSHHYVRGADAERASVFLERGGDRAASVYGNELAVTYYVEALAQFERLRRAREGARVRVKLARVLALTAQTDEALKELDQAVEAFRQEGDLEAEVRATAELALVHAQRGHAVEGIERLRPLLEPLAALGPSEELATAYLAFANLCLSAGDYLKQLEASESASSVARAIGADLLHARAETRRGAALALLGRLKDADMVARAALPELEAAADLPTLARTTNNLAWGAMLAGDFERHRDYARRALETARKVGDPALIAVDTCTLGRAHFFLNDYRAARPLIEEGVRSLDALGPSSQTAYAYAYLGQLTEAEGKFEEAACVLQSAIEVGRKAGDLQVLRIAAVWLSEMDIWEGRLELARERLERLVALDKLNQGDEGTMDQVDMLFVLPALANVWQRLRNAGRLAIAPVPPEELTAHAVERCRSGEITLYLQAALCGHGEVLTLQGKWDEADAALSEALSLSLAMNFQWRQVTTLRALAIRHRLKGEREQEQDCIAKARRILGDLGADHMAARFTGLVVEPSMVAPSR